MNGVNEGACLWLLHVFMKHPATAALKARIAFYSMLDSHQKEGTVMTFCEAADYLLEA